MKLSNAEAQSGGDQTTVRMRPAQARPSTAAELACWPTQLFATCEGPLCAIVVPAAPGWPNVALLHGWAMNRSAWARAALPLVEAGFGVFIPDLAGHGDSPDLSGRLGERPRQHFPRMAAQLLDAVAQLGWARLSVAGYSMGAMVALAMSRAAPDVIERLMLLDPIVRIPALQMLLNPGSHSRFYRKMAQAFVAAGNPMPTVFAALTMCGLPLPTMLRKPAIRALMDRRGFGTNSVYESYVPETHASDVDAFLAGLERTDRRAIMRCFEAKNRSDFMADLLAFRGPLSLVTAEDDAFCPPVWLSRVADNARARGVAAQCAVIEDCDHLSVCQRPVEVAAAMMVWLERPTGRR